jgi:hypothetical protein
MINLDLKIVGLDDFNKYWAQCEFLLEQGLADSEGEMQVSDLLEILLGQKGAFLLLGLDASDNVHAAMALQFQTYPNYTIAHIYSIGGRGVLANRQHWGAIKAWMKSQGASKVQGVCKPAQARLWKRIGLLPTYTLIREDL